MLLPGPLTQVDDLPIVAPPASAREPQWPASVALLVGILLLLSLPQRIEIGPLRWILPGIEILAAIILAVGWPDRMRQRERRSLRALSIGLIAALTAANMLSLGILVRHLLEGGEVDGGQLVRSAVAIWGTNVIAFGCWFWELDGGGPYARRDDGIPNRDFLFPQMTDDGRPYADPGWFPTFLDYLYVSFTNATAFSPTDTLPLTIRSKLLMAVQSITALVTLAVIAARAINILH